MFHHALKQLVKNVRCNRQIDVGQWELFPEWMVDGLEASFTACSVKRTNTVIGQKICINCHSLHAQRKGLVFAKLVRGNLTFWALAAVCTGHEDLLRVITYKVGKYRMTSPPGAITAHHGDSGFAVVTDRIQYIVYACME